MGATCPFCEKDMSAVDGCEWNKTVNYGKGVELPSLPFESDDPNDRCHDCNVKVGVG